MITVKQRLINYAKAAYQLGITSKKLENFLGILEESQELVTFLKDRSVIVKDKQAVVSRICESYGEDDKVRRFLLYLTGVSDIIELPAIVEAVDDYMREREFVLEARLYCVTKPTQETEDDIAKFLLKYFHKEYVHIDIEIHEDLIGGFVLRVGDITFDRSIRSAMIRMKRMLTQ